jgi:hypothetical protein
VTVLRCKVVRGLVKEVEEELNKFLATHPVRVQHMAQSEAADHISVTVIFEVSEELHAPDGAYPPASAGLEEIE